MIQVALSGFSLDVDQLVLENSHSLADIVNYIYLLDAVWKKYFYLWA